MKKRIVVILVCMLLLLLAIIPSTSIAKEIPMQGEPDYTFLLGTIVINKIENNSIYGFAIRLRFFELGETRTLGWITFRNVVVDCNYTYFPIIGNLHFIAGIGIGGLEIIW